MPLRQKLLLSMAIPGLLLVALGVIGIYSLGHLEQAAGRILADNYRSIQEARRMSRALRRLETPDVEGAGAATVEAGQAAARELEDALRRCEGNITETGEIEILRRIRASLEALRPALEAGAVAGLGLEPRRAVQRIHAGIEELVLLNERAMIAYERESRSVAQGMKGAVAASALVALAALALFALVSAQRIARPVTEVADRLHQALSPASPDRPPAAARSVDEIDRLRQELEALLGRLAIHQDTQARKLVSIEESRRRFISMLSHQLKTPMTSLTMSVNLIREKLKDVAPAQAELLSIATENCRSLSALVSDLIEAAREITPDLALKTRRTNLARLLRSALRPLAPQAEDKGVALVVPAEEPAILANVDPVKFPWVVANIAGNALRYTERGGRIEVAVAAREGQVEVSVDDTGTGIARENLERIFQPYVSLDREPQPGTHGLGLAIAKEIVEAHGGAIEAASELGRGTRFLIRLPAGGNGP